VDLSHWPETEAELEQVQIELARRANEVEPWPLPVVQTLAVAGVFIAYRTGIAGVGAAGDPAWLSAVSIQGGVVIASSTITGQVGAPYRPGLLALREGPLLEKVVQELIPRPDIVLVNATGRDHPRRAGLALHLGAVLGLPTVGVTDRGLIATGGEPESRRGARAALMIGSELVGYRLRTRAGVRPLFVHAGWRTLPEAACEVVLAVTGRSRTPEPLREARRLARSFRSLRQPGGLLSVGTKALVPGPADCSPWVCPVNDS
jgi:deoxyribonuclease V